jgi:voltage-gated potassium channel
VLNRIHEILDHSDSEDRITRSVAILISTVILLSTLAIILETEGSVYSRWMSLFQGFEAFSICLFTIEYFLRILSATADERYRHPFYGRLKYAVTPFALIDLAVILPFFISGSQIHLSFLRIFRLFRLLRLVKLARYSAAFHAFQKVLIRSKEQLAIAGLLLLVIAVTASSLMYVAESQAQPAQFGSIPSSMWWTFATMTTIGYGDVYPITPFGKFLGAITAILGIALFALPTAILGAAFLHETGAKPSGTSTCPHCGKTIEAEHEESKHSGG